jgi:oxygen-dependent protoporphyrinogen oxidase
VKYPNRSPAGQVLLRVFLGGATRPRTMMLDDDELVSQALQDLEPILEISGQPLIRHVTRWPGVMPQYHVGHLDLVEQIEAETAKLPGIELAGNSYRGVGIPHCIHSGEQAAERLLDSLQTPANLNCQPTIVRRTTARQETHTVR